MFVQEFHGKIRDRDLWTRQMDRWRDEIRPNAEGFLGSTAGVTSDGTMVAVACFENEQLARAHSEKPEQSAWFDEMSKAFDGELTFHDYTDVDLYRDGVTNDAHFVQVMQGHAKDMAAMRSMEQQFESQLAQLRPDLLGTVTGWEPNGDFTSIAFFSSEQEARANERATSDDPSFREYMSQVDGEMTFYDLREPMFA